MIILNIAKRVVGMVVDSVSDVMQLSAEQIRPAPEFGASVDTRFITALAAIDAPLLILALIEKLTRSPDLDLSPATDGPATQHSALSPLIPSLLSPRSLSRARKPE